jgi:DNA sulfur modification protein DndB
MANGNGNGHEEEGVKMLSFTTQKEAYDYCAKQAQVTGARWFNVSTIRQGNRTMLQTAMPFVALREVVELDPAIKGGSIDDHANRPIDNAHVERIERYVERNQDLYFLPPITLNVKDSAIVVEYGEAVQGIGNAYLLLAAGTKLRPVDGQHKLAALLGYTRGLNAKGEERKVLGVIDRVKDLETDGLGVLMTLESDEVQIHQDFADASKTKPISASIRTGFDMREPINLLIASLVELVPFLDGRVDMTSDTPSRSNIISLKQLKTFVKTAYTGNERMSEPAYESLVRQDFARDEYRQQVVLDKLAYAINSLANKLPGWQEAAVADDVRPLRSDYLSLKSSGLTIIAYTVYNAMQRPSVAEQEELYDALAQLEWEQSAKHWQELGIVVATDVDGDTRYTTVQSAPILAHAKMSIWRKIAGLD